MTKPRYVLTELDAEWQRLIRQRSFASATHTWAQTNAVFAGFATLGDLLMEIETAELDRSCELVWALLELAETDATARRVLLHVIVPGLAGEARWLMDWAKRSDAGLVSGGDVDQMLVLAGLEAIEHAVGHRRAWPISSMLRRAHRVLRRETKTRSDWYDRVDNQELFDDAVVAPGQVDVRPAMALLELLGAAKQAGTVSARDARLVWLIGVEGYTSSELAGPFDMSPRSVAQQRYRAEGRLAAMVEVAS